MDRTSLGLDPKSLVLNLRFDRTNIGEPMKFVKLGTLVLVGVVLMAGTHFFLPSRKKRKHGTTRKHGGRYMIPQEINGFVGQVTPNK
jgi:hypothetical protein